MDTLKLYAHSSMTVFVILFDDHVVHGDDSGPATRTRPLGTPPECFTTLTRLFVLVVSIGSHYNHRLAVTRFSELRYQY